MQAMQTPAAGVPKEHGGYHTLVWFGMKGHGGKTVSLTPKLEVFDPPEG